MPPSPRNSNGATPADHLIITITMNYIYEAHTPSERIRRIHEAARSGNLAVRAWARQRFRSTLKMTGFQDNEPEAQPKP